MRNILILLSLFFFSSTFAQSKTKEVYAVPSYTITKAKLSEVKLLSDLIPDIPPTYTALLYEMTFKLASVVHIINGSGMEIKPENIRALSQASVRTKMFVDLKIHDQKKSIARTYIFYIKE